MTLLEAIKTCTVYNLDEEEDLLIIGENWGEFYHNLEAINCEGSVDVLANIEMTPDVIKLLEADETDDLWDEGSINYNILCAAWLTAKGYDYAVCKENDEYDDLYEDWHKYSYIFADPDFSYNYECDVDLT